MVEAGHVTMFFAEASQGRKRSAQPNQLLIKFPKGAKSPFAPPFVIELGTQKNGLVLRVRRFSLPAEGGELRAPSLMHRPHQFGVAVADKKLKRRLFAVFLTHEKQRDKGSQQHCRGSEFQL